MKQSAGEGWGLRGGLLWYVRWSQLAWEKGPQKVREGAGNMGRAFQRVRTHRYQKRKLGLREVQKLPEVTRLAQDKAGVPTWAALILGTAQLVTVWQALVFPCWFHPHPAPVTHSVSMIAKGRNQLASGTIPLLPVNSKLQSPDSQHAIKSLVLEAPKLPRTCLPCALSCQATPCLGWAHQNSAHQNSVVGSLNRLPFELLCCLSCETTLLLIPCSPVKPSFPRHFPCAAHFSCHEPHVAVSTWNVVSLKRGVIGGVNVLTGLERWSMKMEM